MSKIQMAVLDLDGTLLDAAGRLSQRERQAVRRAVEMGVTVTVSSGRPYMFVKPLLDQLGLDVPVMCCNGAMVRDSKAIYYQSRFPRDKAQKVMEIARQNETLLYVFGADCIFCKPQKDVMRLFRDMDLEELMKRDGGMLVFCDSYEEALERGGDIVKLLIVEYDLEKYAKMKRDVLACGVWAVTPERYNLDICPEGVSKGEALKRVAAQMGIPLANILAIGDGENDLPMLQEAGIGVAMGNAPEDVRAGADYVTAAVGALGAALALARFILEDKHECCAGKVQRL